MRKYRPEQAPDPKDWERHSEDERLAAVEAYHRRNKIELPNSTMHATFHVVIENQIAMGDEQPAARTVERLMREDGMDRHEALHTVGYVFSIFLFRLQKEHIPFDEEQYEAELDALTLKRWHEMAEEE